jgi:hypothetical protein
MDDTERTTRRPDHPEREERSLTTDAATVFLTSAAGGAGLVTGLRSGRRSWTW